MPKKKPAISEDVIPETESLDSNSKRRAKRVILPLTDEGLIDHDRIKDPSTINTARTALEMPVIEASVKPQAFKIPTEAIPALFDGLAMAIGATVRLVKWPRVMNDEQRKDFAARLKYSDDFKDKAKEPTANLLSSLVGGSKFAVWLAEHSELATLGILLYTGTADMFQRAAAEWATDMMKAKAEAVKPNGGFPASENRQPPSPSVIATGQ